MEQDSWWDNTVDFFSFASEEGSNDLWDYTGGRSLGNAFTSAFSSGVNSIKSVGSSIGNAFGWGDNNASSDSDRSNVGVAPTTAVTSAYTASAGSPLTVSGGTVDVPKVTPGGVNLSTMDPTSAYLLGRNSQEDGGIGIAELAIGLSPIVLGMMNAKAAKKENKKNRTHEEELQDERIAHDLRMLERKQEHENSLTEVRANFDLRNAVKSIQDVQGPGVSISGSSNVHSNRPKKDK